MFAKTEQEKSADSEICNKLNKLLCISTKATSILLVVFPQKLLQMETFVSMEEPALRILCRCRAVHHMNLVKVFTRILLRCSRDRDSKCSHDRAAPRFRLNLDKGSNVKINQSNRFHEESLNIRFSLSTELDWNQRFSSSSSSSCTCRMDSMMAAVLLSGGSLPFPAFTMYSPYRTS